MKYVVESYETGEVYPVTLFDKDGDETEDRAKAVWARFFVYGAEQRIPVNKDHDVILTVH